MRILGISAYYHDSAASLIVDGKIVAAAQEERFTRKKHDSGFPANAINFCLKEAGISGNEVDQVVFYEKPLPKFERLLETYFAYAPYGFKSFSMAMPVWLSEKLFQKRNLVRELKETVDPSVNWVDRMAFSEHHLSHAASAFYPSPFETAAVLTMDGVGEWPTTSLAVGNGSQLEIIKEIHFPHSLGLLYSAFTYFTGFKVNSGEYKVMGLAPYGKPIYTKTILDNLVDLKEDGSFHLNMDYFDYPAGLRMTNKKFAELFGGKVRKSESELTQREMDLAASIQEVTEEVVLRLGKSIASETGQKNLCLAGGVALNCVANGKLLRAGYFENIWIQPAAGDAGGALGAALAAHHLMNGAPRTVNKTGDDMKGSYLGTHYNQSEIESRLTAAGAVFETVSDDQVIEQTATALAEGQAVGWHQGRMEFGPRALGGRSILADPRNADTQKTLNLKVKFRESFRPFAPSVLREHVSQWFDLNTDSPYMLLVADVAKNKQIPMTSEQQSLFGIEKLNIPRSEIPAVTHVDYSARIQTVHQDTNPRYHALIQRFFEKTGCPVIVNTSFNVRGEPIVESPEDAFRCFMGSHLDFLAVGNAILRKANQRADLIEDYKDKYELD
ncbi:MAG: Decarbamoylnovobiocin carbamoyltransferase [Actinomycetota bacterium]|jgi:carbamoyltransferase